MKEWDIINSHQKNCIQRLFFTLLSSIIIFGSIGFPASTEASTAVKVPKATWLWKVQLIETQSDELLSFAASEGIYVIYLQVSKNVDIRHYKSFISKANQYGIEIHALNGAPNWALEANRKHLRDFMDWIRDYQQSAAAEEKFTGIHVDIEPYLTQEWKNNVYDVIPQWQSNVEFLVQEAANLNLPIAADLPFWLDKYTVEEPDDTSETSNTSDTSDTKETLSSWMISKYESVTLMSYRDTAKAVIGLAVQEFEEAEALNKRVYTAVETKYSSEGDHVSFYKNSYEYLNSELAKLEQLGGQYSTFGGIAVHDLLALKEMAERN
ncbi:hypothetical protein [Paenibacillus fonticola]|uniref:hypothetical protein n=1 Tax=Paenibacillus fonticola TaxID=379896 RepID=UPI000381EDB4|nr:hypothetical protein [Paenibacillus fonticola]